MAGRADCQQGGDGRGAGSPNARDAGAACRVRLDGPGCCSRFCVAAAELLREVCLLALACDDEDSAYGERGAIGELNAVQAPVMGHEAADTLCLDRDPGGMEPLTLGGIELVAVCQQYDLAAPPAEQQCPIDSALRHAAKAQLREGLSADFPTMAMWAGDNIPPPQLGNTWHVREFIDEPGGENDRAGLPDPPIPAGHVETATHWCVLDPDHTITFQRNVVVAEGRSAGLQQGGRGGAVLSEEVVHVRGGSVPGATVINHDHSAACPA